MKNWFLIIGLLAAMVMGCSNEAQNSTATKAKSFSLTTIDGRTVTLNDYKGKVLILDVWDTWCPPCRMEIPHFVDLYKTYKSSGLEILGVAVGREGLEKVKKFVADNGVNYTNAILNKEFLDSYGPIEGIPTTFVIDPKGQIARQYTGYRGRDVFEADFKALRAK
jgi:peroxiredoxin